jgi:hypothetical protein
MITRIHIALITGLLAIVGLTACGGSGTKTSSASAQIARNWAAFFNGSTPASRKVELLQDGQRFAPFIKAQAASPLARQAKATVTKVTVVSPTRARVIFTITLAGQPALKNQVGTAVRVNGVWKVSAKSFCALLSPEGAAPPVCRGI